MKRRILCLLLPAVFCAGFLCVTAQQSSFVERKGAGFFEKGKPIFFIGTNYWYGGLLNVMPHDSAGYTRLTRELDFLKSKGVTNLRVIAGAEGSGIVNAVERIRPSLQPSMGEFDSTVLKGLDVLLTEMGKRNLKAVIYLSNNWEWSGGFLQYLNWNGLADSTMRRRLTWDENRDIVSGFYTCTGCKEAYLKQVELITKRVNKTNGKRYIDDAAIMAWEIANEPRPMRPAAVTAYKEWIRSVAAFLKANDPNHLVTIGTEGYIGTETMDVYGEIHADKNVDYLTIHIWPKNWAWFRDTAIAAGMDSVTLKTQHYANAHIAIARKLNKPLVIEEFGLPRDGHSFELTSGTTLRDTYYQQILDMLLESKKKSSPLAGVNFWGFGGLNKPLRVKWQPGDPFSGDPPMEEQGLNSVFGSDSSTWKLLERYAKLLSH